MLELLIYTIVFIVAHGAMVLFFFRMIEENQLLDALFNWHKMLDYTHKHKYKAVEYLGKALGNCDMCTCFWSSFISFFTYRWFAIELGITTITGLATVLWLWVYWGLCAFYSYWFINKVQSNGL